MVNLPLILRCSLAALTSALFLFMAMESVAEEPIQSTVAGRRQPNVVIFLADDQGWGDLSCHGNTNLSTPNIDSLARDGAAFENFYVCAVCAPTRAEFLTGRYHFRTGVSGVTEGMGRINPDETTMADYFQRSGYATGCFGKWHNGTQSPYHPMDRGFDEFYGFTSGHWGHYFSPPLDHNRRRVKGNGYLTDDLTEHAMDFIQRHQHERFFCYVPFNTPHSPFYVDDDWYARFDGYVPSMRHRDPDREDLPTTRAVLAMCENIDWNVGRVLRQLDRLQLSRETIIVYFSDNGPNSFRWNGGMKGKKATVDEGGLRSPLLVRWPGQIPSGESITEVVGAIDLLPTISELATVPAAAGTAIDGRSFAGLLRAQSTAWPDRNLFSQWRDRVTIRTNRFRLDERGSLFIISEDRGQRRDISDRYPDITQRLRTAAEAYRVEARGALANNMDRPFTVGYAASTTLPARDGTPHGNIRRSSKAPNNSFFVHWTDPSDSITWDVQIGQAGRYKATVYYTCPEPNVGATIRLSLNTYSDDRARTRNHSSTEAVVTEAFDPPQWDKTKERVAESHYFVKDFKPLTLGRLDLPEARGVLRLTMPNLVGQRGVDVHSIELEQTFP